MAWSGGGCTAAREAHGATSGERPTAASINAAAAEEIAYSWTLFATKVAKKKGIDAGRIQGHLGMRADRLD